MGGIDPDSGIGVWRLRHVYTKRISDRFQAPLEQYGTERVRRRRERRTPNAERQTLNAKRLPKGRVQKALDGHRDDDRAAKNIFDLPLGSVDR